MESSQQLRPGDSVVVAQAGSTPRRLVHDLISEGKHVSDVTVLTGLSDPQLLRALASRFHVRTYGSFGRAVQDPSVTVAEFPLGVLGRRIDAGLDAVDVVVLAVPPADDKGFHSLGPSVDYLPAALRRARTVRAQVNPRLPVTLGHERVHRSAFDVYLEESEQPDSPPRPEPAEVARRVAEGVASIVPDGATIQIGIGALAEAIASALSGHRGLGVHSGLVGDWLLTLQRSGAVTNDRKRIDLGVAVATTAYGSEELYGALHLNPTTHLRPLTYTHDPGVLARLGNLVAVNSALEVDLLGQANAERIGSRWLGGLGGQPEFMRAAASSPEGTAVLALPSTTDAGRRSRIVPTLSGPVTTPHYDVDVVVTEHGVAVLRGLNHRARAERLIAVADPPHRSWLAGSVG